MKFKHIIFLYSRSRIPVIKATGAVPLKSWNFSGLFRVPQFPAIPLRCRRRFYAIKLHNPLGFSYIKKHAKRSGFIISGLQFDNWLFGPRKFPRLSRNRPQPRGSTYLRFVSPARLSSPIRPLVDSSSSPSVSVIGVEKTNSWLWYWRKYVHTQHDGESPVLTKRLKITLRLTRSRTRCCSADVLCTAKPSMFDNLKGLGNSPKYKVRIHLSTCNWFHN